MSLNPKVTDLGSKVRLEWTPDLTCQGYRFYVDGVAVARTFKATASSTEFGKPDANSHAYGVQRMDVIPALEAAVWPVPPPPTGKPLVSNITSGGTYTGAVQGAVKISTVQPVVLDTFSCGTIDAYNAGAGLDLIVRKGNLTGADAWDSPRWLVAQNWKRLVIENNTIVNTRGIELWPNSQPNPTTIITRNKHTNPKGNGISPVGNFVQMRAIWGSPKYPPPPLNPSPGTIEISWNEIISEYNKSDAEDIISIYKTAHVRCHDNLINGQSKPSSMSGSSQNSITIDPADEPGLLFDNIIERNFVIDAYAIGMFGGNNNTINDNWIVSDGYIGDTGQKMLYGYEGIWVAPGFTGNEAGGNQVGYIGSQGRNDGRLNTSTGWTNNTHLPDPITRQTELDAIATWRKRVSDAGIKIGA